MRKIFTPKQRVVRRYPEAELVKDGCIDNGGSDMKFFDYAVYTKPGEHGVFLAMGDTPRIAWKQANDVLRRRGRG